MRSPLFRRPRADHASPLPGEFPGFEGLEERAKALAAVFTLAPSARMGGPDVLPRLTDNLGALETAYGDLADDVHRGVAVPPAAEWLLDNFHLVESEARAVQRDLPARYYRTLPKLAARERAGQARIHGLAVELIVHGDGRLDLDRLTRFVLAFQTVAPLTIGELWALPSMLKLALLENLRILSDGILAGRAARREADREFARLELGASPGPLPEPLPSAFVAQLRARMREYDPRVSPLAAAVQLSLAARGTNPEEEVRRESQRQATDQVSAGNTVTSLRFSATLDWSRFVESVSPVEEILRRDPAGVYPRMDFPSRDRYRHAVEDLAEPSGGAQVRVALRTVESARQAAELRGIGDRAAHVGHHLIGRGRRRRVCVRGRIECRGRRRHRRAGRGRRPPRPAPRQRARGAPRAAPLGRARAAAPAPPSRLQRGDPRGRAHDGGGARTPGKRGGGRAAPGTPGGAGAGQPRPADPLRGPQRLHGRSDAFGRR